MLAVVTGASGLLGANLVAELRAAGHRVRATRRARSVVEHLADLEVEWCEADLDRPDALARAFTGADVVYHCAALVSIIRRATPALVAANVTGTANVLDAVRAAGRPRLVHCSTVCAVGLSEDGAPCTESARWNFAERAMDDGYATTKRRSEDLVRDAAAGGLDAVICNPCYLLGPRDARPSSGKLIVDVVRGKVPGWTPGFNNFVDVRDVARGMLLAATRGRSGERYILGGENMSYRDIMATVARVAGVPPPARRVPRWLAAAFGWAGDLQERVRGAEPLINSVVVRYGFCPDFIFSSEKARGELGYAPGPIEPAIADAIAWFRARGLLP